MCHDMETENIYIALNNLSPITEEAWADLRQLFEPLELKRNEYFVREGSRVISCCWERNSNPLERDSI